MEKEFIKLIYENPEFLEALEIVERNSSGNIWLIGGLVYRNLAHILYDVEKPETDYDFIVEKPKKIVLPSNWKLKKNRYDGPKFVGEKFNIDFIPLSSVHSILRRKLDFTFENYLTGTPLTIQSIGYSIDDKKILGDVGLRALLDRTVGVNNLEQAEIYSFKKGRSIEEIIRRKAESLGFRALQ